ncbi:hypothetical protein K439DRAFT_1203321 [Ramaria rubella]|nr:hypothetical protein K439DRAFT_1203321 [Ramaria rubella]
MQLSPGAKIASTTNSSSTRRDRTACWQTASFHRILYHIQSNHTLISNLLIQSDAHMSRRPRPAAVTALSASPCVGRS